MPNLQIKNEVRDENTRMTLTSIKENGVTGFSIEKTALGEHPIEFPSSGMKLTYFQLLDLRSMIEEVLTSEDVQEYFGETDGKC